MDEFGIDLDKVLDEFEEREEGNVSVADGFQRGLLPRELKSTDVDESKPLSNFPAFEGFDLDLAEADFAPSNWNYEISSEENGRSDFTVAATLTSDKEFGPVRVPDVELLRNKSGADCENAEVLPAVNQSLTSKVDVLSACLYTCVAEPGMEEQLGNRTREEVATSPPDIVCSAPDVVSSAMVGVDVVPSSRTDSDTLAKPSFNQESKVLPEQSAASRSDCEVYALESLDVILQKSNVESVSTDLQEEEKRECYGRLSDDTLSHNLKTKSHDSPDVQETYHSPAAATEIPSSYEDAQKYVGVDLDGDGDTAATAECFDTENSSIKETTESAITVDKSHLATAPPQQNEKRNDIGEGITFAFSPFPPIASSCDTEAEVSSEALHKEVCEGSGSISSEVLDQIQGSAAYVDGLKAGDMESLGFEAHDPENEEICSAEAVIRDQGKSSSLEILTDQSASFDSQAQLESAEYESSDSSESVQIRDENSETLVRESEDLKEISERRGEDEVISESEVHCGIFKKQSEEDMISSPEHSEIICPRDPVSVQQTEECMKMSLEDEKHLQEWHKDAEKSVTEGRIVAAIDLVDRNEAEPRNKLGPFCEERSKLFDDGVMDTEELKKQSGDMGESADSFKEMANEETTKMLSFPEEDSADTTQKRTSFVGFGGAEAVTDLTQEEIDSYLREFYIQPDNKATDTHKKPDGDDDVESAPKKDGIVGIENRLYEAAISDKTSEFNAAVKEKLLSDELNQLNMLSSPSDSFMLVNSHGAELDVPIQFGNLADEQVESLMKEVEEEVRQMLDGEAVMDGDGDQSHSNSEAGIVPSSLHADKTHEESFEDQAMFVVYGSEAKDGKVLKKVLNSEANRSHVTRLDSKDAVLNEVVPSQSDVDTGLDANACSPRFSSAEDVGASDHHLLLPVMNRFDHLGEAPSNMLSSTDCFSPADASETQPESLAPETGARQKEMKAVKPDSLDLASSLQQQPIAPLTEASAEGNQATVVPSDAQSSTSSSLPPGILSPSAVSTPTIPLCSNISLEITQLGKVPPFWLPDAEASKCMECEIPFSFTRRRHHCRACGKVFCHGCSNLRATLQYLENRQDRVCSKCYQDLVRASFYERNQPAVSMRLNPNDSGSTISSPVPAQASSEPQQPHQQYQTSASAPTGVLRKQGSIKGEAKQVMFSDGIRPGGDLTDLDGSSDVRHSARRSRKADKSSPVAAAAAAQTKDLVETKRTSCLIPSSGLPPVVITSATNVLTLKDDIPAETILQRIKDEQDPSPVTFAINRDVVVLVKIINLDCCVNRLCWCFTTKGLCTVGQDEIVIILECLPDEKTVPLDILQHLHVVYEMASHGNTVNNLDHTVLPTGKSLGSHEVGGFLYIRQTFQCLQKIILPEPPYLFGLLLQKWEMSWARVFPLRLMFRLGAEFRYYPSPLISVRSRKPVYGEIGHTIMNLLADFHNYQYMIPRINGLVIHMEDKRTTVSIPRNRYNMLMKILSNSDDHVIALGASFSSTADSHLVCLQNEDGNYQTQAINIQNRPRRVTGACFIVFNGALKPTSGLRAKSSIVEDGLMVQITSDAMTELKQVLSETKDYKILCGSIEIAQPEEMVIIEWNNDEKHINAGVKSPIDGLSMYGVDSIRIHSSTDFAKDELTIRWTEVFVLRNGASQGASSEAPSEVSHLAESLAQACCQALVGHLSRLAFEMLNKIALRVTIDTEQVGYEIGSRGVRLPDFCMNDLDEKLIGIIHGAASQARSGPIVLELIFHILHPYISQSGRSAATPAK